MMLYGLGWRGRWTVVLTVDATCQCIYVIEAHGGPGQTLQCPQRTQGTHRTCAGVSRGTCCGERQTEQEGETGGEMEERKREMFDCTHTVAYDTEMVKDTEIKALVEVHRGKDAQMSD